MAGFSRRQAGLGMGALVLGAALLGCGSQDAEQPTLSPTSTASVPTSEVTEQPSASASQGSPQPSSSLPAPSTSASESTSCGSELSDRDVAALAEQLPAPNDSTGKDMDWEWDAEHADTAGYEPCADLSWITFPIERGTGSSPYTIALFHQGDYLGVTTSRTFGFFPQVERVEEGQISVTYTYAKEGDSNAGASGRATSTFTWDAQSGTVDHQGQLPPE